MDFGSQGDYPSHLELLDWLARDFVEGGWSRKRALRQIVTSRTYRQSSRRRPELEAVGVAALSKTGKEPSNARPKGARRGANIRSIVLHGTNMGGSLLNRTQKWSSR